MLVFDKISFIKRILIIIGTNFLMFALLLLTSDSIFVLNQRLPDEVIFVSAVIGIVGSGLYLINKTRLRYLVFWPPILFAILFIIKSDPYAF